MNQIIIFALSKRRWAFQLRIRIIWSSFRAMNNYWEALLGGKETKEMDDASFRHSIDASGVLLNIFRFELRCFR